MKMIKVIVKCVVCGTECECLERVVNGEEAAQALVNELTAKGVEARWEAANGKEWWQDNNWIG